MAQKNEKQKGRLSAVRSNDLLGCPDCGGPVQYYHGSFKFEGGMTRIVCKKKCKGWKVIHEFQRHIGSAT